MSARNAVCQEFFHRGAMPVSGVPPQRQDAFSETVGSSAAANETPTAIQYGLLKFATLSVLSGGLLLMAAGGGHATPVVTETSAVIEVELPGQIPSFKIDAETGYALKFAKPTRPISMDMGWHDRLGTLQEQRLYIGPYVEQFIPADTQSGSISTRLTTVTSTTTWNTDGTTPYTTKIEESGNPFCGDSSNVGANGLCEWEHINQIVSSNGPTIPPQHTIFTDVAKPAVGNPKFEVSANGNAAGVFEFSAPEDPNTHGYGTSPPNDGAPFNVHALYNYAPFTTAEYVYNAIADAGAFPTANDLTVPILDDAWSSQIIPLRETSDETSSQNLNLRDAEYFLRGYAGGVRRRTMDYTNYVDPTNTTLSKKSFLSYISNVFANVTVPDSAPIYNALKTLQNGLFGSGGATETKLAASPIGGVEISRLGWYQGYFNLDPNPTAAPISYDELIRLLKLEAEFNNPGDTTPSNLLAPTETFYYDNVILNEFLFDANGNGMTYFDPPSATDYAYSVDGNMIGSILVPGGQGFDTFEVSFGDLSFLLNVDQEFLFTDFFANGVDNFLLSNFDNPITGDLVVGLNFLQAGPTLLVQAQRVESNSVPEPGTLVLFGVGLAGLELTRRKRAAQGKS